MLKMRIQILNYLKDNQLIMKIKKEKYEIKRGLFYIRTIIKEEGEGRRGKGEREEPKDQNFKNEYNFFSIYITHLIAISQIFNELS